MKKTTEPFTNRYSEYQQQPRQDSVLGGIPRQPPARDTSQLLSQYSNRGSGSRHDRDEPDEPQRTARGSGSAHRRKEAPPLPPDDSTEEVNVFGTLSNRNAKFDCRLDVL